MTDKTPREQAIEEIKAVFKEFEEGLKVNKVFIILKSLGYVKIAEDQSLPENKAWHKVEREFEAYCAGRNDMLSAGWVKVKKE